MKAGEAVRVMGDIIPAQLWGLRGRLRVLSHDDLRVGRVLRLWMPRRSQTSLNPFSPPLFTGSSTSSSARSTRASPAPTSTLTSSRRSSQKMLVELESGGFGDDVIQRPNDLRILHERGTVLQRCSLVCLSVPIRWYTSWDHTLSVWTTGNAGNGRR